MKHTFLYNNNNNNNNNNKVFDTWIIGRDIKIDEASQK